MYGDFEGTLSKMHHLTYKIVKIIKKINKKIPSTKLSTKEMWPIKI